MISKSLKQVFARQNAGVVRTQTRAMGGGDKRPNCPAGQTDFDVVLVGK